MTIKQPFFTCLACSHPSPCRIRGRCALSVGSDTVPQRPISAVWTEGLPVKITGTRDFNGMSGVVIQYEKRFGEKRMGRVPVFLFHQPHVMLSWFSPRNLVKAEWRKLILHDPSDSLTEITDEKAWLSLNNPEFEDVSGMVNYEMVFALRKAKGAQ